MSREIPPEGPPVGDEPRAGASFLAEASRLLADSLDEEATLATVAGLSLPYFGTWCIVDLHTDGKMERAAIVHRDPRLQDLARRLEDGWPPEGDDPVGISRAVRTGETEVVADVSEEMLVGMARGRENLRILRALGIGSILTVPLRRREEVLGAITYVSPPGYRAHGAADMVLAEDLAARCAVALDNARLHRIAQEANTSAAEARSARGQFLAVMSHELRTPLTAVVAFSELLESEVLGPVQEKQREALERIKTNSWHLVEIIDEVLIYSRAEAGKLDVRRAQTDVFGIASEVGTVLAAEAERTGIALSVERMGPVPEISTDPGKVRQILFNLIGNAIKYTREGSVDVRIGVDPDELEFLQVHVSDTGTGIDARDQERIFEPFTQTDDFLTRTMGGMGLGLSIARKLARLLKGEITVESTPGKGSTFTLQLPRDAEQNGGPPSPQH